MQKHQKTKSDKNSDHSRTAITFETKSGNQYLLSHAKNEILWLHPILAFLIKMYLESINISDWIAKSEDNIEIPGFGLAAKNEVCYYLQKLKFLEVNGFFTPVNMGDILSFRANGQNIRNGLANLPHLILEVTESCILKCKYCGFGEFYEQTGDRASMDMSLKIAKKMISYVVSMRTSSGNMSYNSPLLIGFYGGEPLLKFDFIEEIVRYGNSFANNDCSLRYQITTNGVLLDKYMDFLAQHKFLLFISLDGNKKNNSYRVFPDGKESYDVVFNNIKKLQEKYPEYFERYVNFLSVLHNRNSVSEVNAYFQSQFGKSTQFSELRSTGIAADKREDFLRHHLNLGESIAGSENYHELKRELFDQVPSISEIKILLEQQLSHSYQSPADLMYKKPDKRLPTATCIPCTRRMFLSARGKVLPCEKIDHQFAIGEVNEDGISIDCDRVASYLNTFIDHCAEVCVSCYNAVTCMQCIYHLNILDKNVHCPGYRSKEEYSAYLSRCVSNLEANPEDYLRLKTMDQN